MGFLEAVKKYEEGVINRQMMLSLLKEYKRPNDKISELVKQRELIPLKKGLYIPGPRMNLRGPEPSLVANHLWGPSYVSLESALSYWGLIPERVYEISSITVKSTKTYKTPIGRFSYLHVPLPYYSFGIQSVKLTSRQVILIASPEKALCDKIITTSGVFLRSVSQTKEFLMDDLRLDEGRLQKFSLNEMRGWLNDAPKRASLEMLIKTISVL